ncbi:MAG TPA: hypothetical protein PKX40_07150 [Spirochaetota bacterium]|nr:hypothetical protein [Spirochaetota bacterium]
MKRLLIILTAFISLVIINEANAGTTGTWSLVKNSSGIKVYERSVPGTDLMEYMAVTAIDEKMEVLGEVLRDVPSYRNWIADCHGAQVEKRYDRNTMAIYLVLKPPIIQERDVALKDKTVYDWDRARAAISFGATEEIKIPLEKNRVRVTMMNGVFDMEFLGRNRTKFIYRLLVDPAGDIPKRVAYAVMKSYPYETLKKLRTMVPNRKYSDAARGSEEERAIDTRTRNEAYIQNLLFNRLAKFVGNRAALQTIIQNDRNSIKNIVQSGATYESVEKASMKFYFAYLDSIVPDREAARKLKENKKMVGEIIDMIVTDCGASDVSVESIIAKYK